MTIIVFLFFSLWMLIYIACFVNFKRLIKKLKKCGEVDSLAKAIKEQTDPHEAFDKFCKIKSIPRNHPITSSFHMIFFNGWNGMRPEVNFILQSANRGIFKNHRILKGALLILPLVGFLSGFIKLYNISLSLSNYLALSKPLCQGFGVLVDLFLLKDKRSDGVIMEIKRSRRE